NDQQYHDGIDVFGRVDGKLNYFFHAAPSVSCAVI
ncbi:MAG: hypothetical protein ACI86X_002584, partial [Moritella sp.]